MAHKSPNLGFPLNEKAYGEVVAASGSASALAPVFPPRQSRKCSILFPHHVDSKGNHGEIIDKAHGR